MPFPAKWVLILTKMSKKSEKEIIKRLWESLKKGIPSGIKQTERNKKIIRKELTGK